MHIRHAWPISVLLAGACTISHQQAGPPPEVPYRLLGLALAPDRSWPAPKTDIFGLRLGLAGARHRHVIGVDLPGLTGHRTGCGGGLAAALLVNDTNQSFYGVQLAGAMNTGPYSDRADHRAYGIQVAPANFADAAGVQLGLINGLAPSHDVPHSGIVGVQLGLWNSGGNVYGMQGGGLTAFAHDVWGIQVGTLAMANRVRGIQVGLFTTAFEGGGLQIGLINFNARSILPWCLGLNFSW